MSLLTPVWNYIDALVHPAARQDPLTAARHRAFIALHLLGSLFALACYPAYLTFRGVPSALEIGVFGWLAAPIVLAYFLSRTARYEMAQVLSSLSLAGLVGAVAWCSGGIASLAALWLLMVPLEAAPSGSRRLIALASVFALATGALLVVASVFHLLPPPNAAADQGSLAVLAIISASLYATGLALGSERVGTPRRFLPDENGDRLLVRSMPDVVTRHGRNAAVTFVSPAAEPVFGVRAADLMGHGLFDRVHVADRPAYLTALADAASRGEQRCVEFRIRRDSKNEPQGEFVWLEMRCRPLDGADGNQRDVLAVSRDVSTRKAQEEAAETARVESERASAAKGHFLATMSHELRTPLNAIIGFSDMLINPSMLLDDARRSEYARLINESGHHLLSVVNGILDMSKMETGNFQITPEPFAPRQVVEGCCDLLALKVRDAGLTLRTRIAADLPEVVADRRALNQILLNLISNAIKFTPRGGRIKISASCKDGRLIVVVEDTGIGIGADDLPRLGEAFFQARASYDRHHDGSGLGISIVKGLVHLHGGDMEIRSRLGEGTRVTVRLPVDCEASRSADPIKLVTQRAGELAAVAQLQVKKIA